MDNAGVYRLTDQLALVQTVDFLTPVVDDPYTFGQIAAANSLSDVYAMGARPVTAMKRGVLLIEDPGRGHPEGDTARRGREDIGGGRGAHRGHTVEDPEPKYGLAVTGVINPERLVTTAARRSATSSS